MGEENKRQDIHAVKTYRDAESYIAQIPKFTGKNSMEYTRMFLRHLGNPSRDKKVIHVAGTNGKGSVCAYLCSVLREAKIPCGMFTSPHLVTMRERFVADGEMISEEDFLRLFLRVKEALDTIQGELKAESYHPSFFEYLFFMAMLFFEERQVEYLVLETGLGGRLDATNAVEKKALCIITSIGYDHMEYLGNTLGEIAGEKAGIVQKGVPVIYLKNRPEAREAAGAIEGCAHLAGARCVPLDSAAIKDKNIKNKTIDFSFHLNYDGYVRLTVSSFACYQVENAALACKALACLADGRITVSHMQRGIRKMVWEGRMEEIAPSVYLDGAHNIDGIKAFLDSVRIHPCSGERRLLYSAVKEKQYEAVIECLVASKLFDKIGVVQLKDDRALPLDKLEEIFGQYTGLEWRAYQNLETAFSEFVLKKDDKDKTYIVGSLYLAGEIKALLKTPVCEVK